MELNEYSRTVLFNSGKYNFKDEHYPTLVLMTAILKEYPYSKFVVEGNADSEGTNTMNQTLSENRAVSVKNYLVENGIQADRLQTIGFGETKPIGTNRTAKGKEKNRRVEFSLVKE
jgi:outer membrane protein OmpA-like peptidoglycan-associated protein